MRSSELIRFLPYFMQIGPRVVGFVFGVAFLAGGLPLLSKMFGGSLVTSLIVP